MIKKAIIATVAAGSIAAGVVTYNMMTETVPIETCFERTVLIDYSGEDPARETTHRVFDVHLLLGDFAIVNDGRGVQIWNLATRKRISARQLVGSCPGCHYPLPGDYDHVTTQMSATPGYVFLGSAFGGSLCKLAWIGQGPGVGACNVLKLGPSEGAYLYEDTDGTTYMYTKILSDCDSDLCRYRIDSSDDIVKVNDINIDFSGPNPSGVTMGVTAWGVHYIATYAGGYVLRCEGNDCSIIPDAHASPAMWKRTVAIDADAGLLYTTSPMGREAWDITLDPVLISRAKDAIHGSIAAGDGVAWEAETSPLKAQLEVDGNPVDWNQDLFVDQKNYGASVWHGKLVYAGHSVLMIYDLSGCDGAIFSDGFESGDTSRWYAP